MLVKEKFMMKLIKKILPDKIVRWIRRILDKKKNLIRNKTIPHMGILLTTGCNLNCRHCADLIPYRQFFYYAKEDVIRDLDKVLSSVRRIKEVLLIGGEVMLYKELVEIVNYCISEPKIKKIIITTNGTIIPSQEIWKVLENPKVTLRISGYGTNVAPDRHLLVEEADRRGIRYEDHDGMIWKNVGENYKRYRSFKELKGIFQDCMMRSCVGMTHDGKIFFCSRQVAAYYTSDYPQPTENEYLDVRSSTPQELKKKWSKFYRQKYISTCDYCDGITRDSKAIGTALQIITTKKYVELLKFYVTYNRETIINIHKVSEILESIQDSLTDIREFTQLKEILNKNNIDKNASYFYGLLKEVLKQISEDYRLELYDLNGGGVDAPQTMEYGKKNRIRILISESTEDAAGYDMVVDNEELLRLKDILNWKVYC